MEAAGLTGDLALLHDHGHGQARPPPGLGAPRGPGLPPGAGDQVPVGAGVLPREQHPEAAEGVPRAVLLLEQDPQAVPFGELDGLGEDELRRVGRVELRLDGPARKAAPGERPRDGVVVPAVGGGVLLEVGARGR